MPERFVFSDLRELFAKANEEKSGDQLAGIAARSERERVAAKRKVADRMLGEIVRRPLIDPDHDEVGHLILDTFDQIRFQPIKGLTVGEFREYIRDDTTGETELEQIQRAIIPEIAAALVKIMSNKDLTWPRRKSGTSRAAGIRWVNTECWAFACNRTIRRMMLAGFCWLRLRDCCTDAATQ
jgi:ethanolamine ammonia-lyase large subunit